MAETTLSSSEFKALSSETRTRILKHLKERNYTLSELAKKLGLSSPAVKEHMDLLAGTGLVQLNDEGRKWKYYALTRKGKSLTGSEENKTTFLVILAASTIALMGILMLLANSLNVYQLPGTGGEAPMLATEAAMAEGRAMPLAAQAPAPQGPAKSAAPPAATENEAYAYLAIALGLSAFIGFQAGRLRREAF